MRIIFFSDGFIYIDPFNYDNISCIIFQSPCYIKVKVINVLSSNFYNSFSLFCNVVKIHISCSENRKFMNEKYLFNLKIY